MIHTITAMCQIILIVDFYRGGWLSFYVVRLVVSSLPQSFYLGSITSNFPVFYNEVNIALGALFSNVQRVMKMYEMHEL